MNMLVKYFIIGSNLFFGVSFVDYLLCNGNDVIGVSCLQELYCVFLFYCWFEYQVVFMFYLYDFNKDLIVFIGLI